MVTLVLACVSFIVVAFGLGLAWPGHPVVAGFAGMFGFLGTIIGVNLALRRRLEAVFKEVQAHIEGTQDQLRRRITVMQNRNMTGGKALQKMLEKDQAESIQEAIALLDGVAPLRKWLIMAERQANTLRGQLYYQIKDFQNAEACFAKSMVPTPDPLNLAMKMALMHRDGKFEPLEKAFKRGVRRFKDDKGALLYGLYAWSLVKREKVGEALAVLEEGKDKAEHPVLKENWEHLANGRVRQIGRAHV